ncbi:MAG: DUF5106 domain-containing protein [Bacteroidales bacterium]|nr:DUF5106 domain-containing protein [Bacteroidales bacterium]
MESHRLISLLLVPALLLSACRGGNRPAEAVRQMRSFSLPEIPAVYADPGERQDYLLEHFWDPFFAGDGPCDTGAVLGVERGVVEEKFALYTQLLSQLPLDYAQGKMRHFFSQVEGRQAADTSSLVFLQLEEIVSHYLYDPNSPLRDEDLYLPYVEGLAASPYTREDARPGYVYEARMCALNPAGSQAPDFRFTDLRGRTRNLYGVRAETTLLFFSNPGCYACQEIIGTLEAVPGIGEMIRSGALAVVNVYIDGEVDKWREYAPSYPAHWLCGYETDGRIREEWLYNVRAIPSLYLLDRDKRILMKDAPTERVVAYLQNQQNQ